MKIRYFFLSLIFSASLHAMEREKIDKTEDSQLESLYAGCPGNYESMIRHALLKLYAQAKELANQLLSIKELNAGEPLSKILDVLSPEERREFMDKALAIQTQAKGLLNEHSQYDLNDIYDEILTITREIIGYNL